MRNRRTIPLISLVILASITIGFLEFFLPYAMDSRIYGTLLSYTSYILVLLILLSFSRNYEVIYITMLIEVLFSSAVIVLHRFNQITIEDFNQNKAFLIVLHNFFIPTVLCFIRNLFDHDNRLSHYRKFAYKSIALFCLYYIPYIFYVEFFLPSRQEFIFGHMNLIPFYTIAGYIEDYIYKLGSFHEILEHLLPSLLLFFPASFLLCACFRHRSTRVQIFLLLASLVIIELIQQLREIERFNIDHIIYGLLGAILGQLFFHLINVIYSRIRGHEFLEDDNITHSFLRF